MNLVPLQVIDPLLHTHSPTHHTHSPTHHTHTLTHTSHTLTHTSHTLTHSPTHHTHTHSPTHHTHSPTHHTLTLTHPHITLTHPHITPTHPHITLTHVQLVSACCVASQIVVVDCELWPPPTLQWLHHLDNTLCPSVCKSGTRITLLLTVIMCFFHPHPHGPHTWWKQWIYTTECK